MYLAIIVILPLLGLIVLGYWLGSGYIKSKIFKVLLSFTFYILLLLPFKVILPLLDLDYLFPIFSGLFACIFTVASCLFDNNNKLFSFIQLFYIFIMACMLGYTAYAFRQCEFIYLIFAFMPMSVEGGINDHLVHLPSKLVLFVEGNESPSPPTNSPIPGFDKSPSTSRSVSPKPGTPGTPRMSFEEELWYYRFRSLEDARRLDIAKRILLHKIIASKSNVPYEIEQSIQDHIWGNHWYDVYRRPRPFIAPPYFVI